jgi:drug/metabolite transporter (DMT)-like permease
VRWPVPRIGRSMRGRSCEDRSHEQPVLQKGEGILLMMVAYLAAIIAAILWGASFLLTKIVLTQLGPMSTAALRWAVAALALIIISTATTRGRKALRRALRDDVWSFVGLGLVGVSLLYALQNLALVYTTSVDVGLIMNGVPVLAAVLGVWLLGEQLPRRAVAGVVVALVGVTFITLGGLSEAATTARARVLGDFLAVMATLFAGLYIVGGKRAVRSYDPITVTVLASVFGALMLMPVAAWEGLTLRLSVGAWVALLGLALGSGAAANWLWWYAASCLPVSRAGAFLYFTPVVSTLFGVALLGEPLTAAAVVGAALVLGGVMLVQA